MFAAIRMDSAIREFQKRNGAVNVAFFWKSLDDELVHCWNSSCSDIDTQFKLEVATIFNGYPADKDGPRLHPIVGYIGEKSEKAEVDGKALDLRDIKLSDVAQKCTEIAASFKSWPPELSTPDLTTLLKRIPKQYQWWLPPLPHGSSDNGEDNGLSPTICDDNITPKHLRYGWGSSSGSSNHCAATRCVSNCCSLHSGAVNSGRRYRNGLRRWGHSPSSDEGR